MFVTKNLNCYKMANNGWISIVKVCIGAYGYSASRKAPKDPKNPLRFFLFHTVGPEVDIDLKCDHFLLK